jgi:hypothetical protein
MTSDFPAGNYRFIPAVFQYSGGVAASPGYEIERVRFENWVPLAKGFAQIAKYIQAAGRPLTSFCACELRSPAAFTDEGFRNFNLHYVKTLAEWAVYDGKTNPVARSNVCPEIDPPAEPSFYAFSFTTQDPAPAPSFVVAGSGEAQEGAARYSERTVRFGETTPHAMRDKAVYVLGEMERRMGLLGFSWADATGAQVYTVHDIHPFLADELARRGAVRHGLTWQFCRPPVRDLEYEMDCRGVPLERVLPAR